MRLHVLTREQRLPEPPEETFELFGDARNLEDITPPWLGFRVVTPEPITMAPGTLIAYRLRLHGAPIRWLTRIEVWEPGRRFVDVQVSGPYALWHHLHEFAPDGDGGTVMRDTVRYGLPFGPFGALAHAVFVRRDVEAIFDFRREAVRSRIAG
ncbi:MAG: SRPBCC family protein [Thermoleophilaceae bacterium]|nr:SRPBCC family protein [Thermoleophilaceae bacterium]